MAWADSRSFRPFIQHLAANLSAFNLASGGDTFRNALYNNSITPDNDVSAANSAYNVGQWATANEVYQSGQWAQAGVALTGQTIDVGTADIVFWDATDTASGSAFTGSNIYGCEIYDDTLTASGSQVADAGVCYIYFGGANSVVAGTLTVIYHANGLVRWTL